MANQYTLITLTNPVEGREDEYNEWYDGRHLEDLLKCPGIISAQRFELADHQRIDPPYPYGYLAVYEIETEDLPGVLAALKERSGTEAMPVSPALGDKRLALIFTARTERRTA